jgi:agmatine/peptidylarginine deiminase
VVFELATDREDPRYEILRENHRALTLQTDAKERAFEILPLEEARAAGAIGPRF